MGKRCRIRVLQMFNEQLFTSLSGKNVDFSVVPSSQMCRFAVVCVIVKRVCLSFGHLVVQTI